MKELTIGQRILVVKHPRITGLEGVVVKLKEGVVVVDVDAYGRTAGGVELQYSQCKPIEPLDDLTSHSK